MSDTTTEDQTYTASLGAILTHTTGKLVAPIDEAWPLQDFLVGRPLLTHERPADEHDVSGLLLEQFPRLAEADPPKITSWAEANAWVSRVAAHVGWSTAQVRR